MNANTSAIAALSAAQINTLCDHITGEWPQVVAVWEDFRQRHSYYLRADVENDRRAFLQQALWAVVQRNHLLAFLGRLSEQGLTDNGITARITELGGKATVQSYVNGAWQPQFALSGGRRLLQACDHVCRIAIGGNHKGTGILIRPNLVVTAGHVVSSLVSAGKARSDSLKQLEISFFDADDMMPDGGVKTAKPISAQLHEDWLAYYSPPTDMETEDEFPIDSLDGIADPAGPWDLAVIRLAAPPRAGLSGHGLLAGAPPPVSFGIHVLHHPADPRGAPMGLLWSVGEVTTALGPQDPLRWLHDANTDRGSSGGPCFDSNWQVIALHQAGQSDITAKNQSNRAVPVYAWANKVAAWVESRDETPYLSQVTDKTAGEVPVFGRRALQRRAWAAMTAPLEARKRIFVVLGDSRSGKTFTTAILSRLAELAGCRLTAIDAVNVTPGAPLDFAIRLSGALGGSWDTVTASGLTTTLRDVHNQIVPRLIQEMTTVAARKPLWLVLDNLDVTDIQINGMAPVIEELLANMEKIPNLNLVLTGWNGPVQADHTEVLPDAPQVGDIAQYLWLSLAPPGIELPRSDLQTLLGLVRGILAAQPPGEPYARAIAAAEQISQTMKPLIDAIAAKPANNGQVPS